MTLGQSQWVGTDDDRVLSGADARNAGSALWATNSADTHDVRYGLVWAGGTNLLTGTSGYVVNVAPHHFIATKGAANGPYLGAARPGGTTAVTVPAAPSLGSKRIDVLWVRQKDKSAISLPDASTAAEYGVATGSPSSSPSKPARGDTLAGFPADATEVGTITWDSTSGVAAGTNASAAGASCTLATTGLWTVPRGQAIPVRNQAERDNTLTGYKGLRVARLDADGAIDVHTGTAWRSSVWTDFTPNLYSGMLTTPVAIGSSLQFARYRYLDAHTVQAKVQTSRVAGGTITNGLGVDLPVPALRRELNCGILVVSGSTAASSQSGRAFMSADKTKLIPVSYTNGYLDVDANLLVQYMVEYEV